MHGGGVHFGMCICSPEVSGSEINQSSRCINGTCLGVGVNGTCARTQDCEPGQYCSMGMCRGYKRVSERCSHRYECGRAGTCLFNNTRSYFGICVPFFKVPNG